MDARISVTANFGGISTNVSQTRSQDGLASLTPTATPATGGMLTTRSSGSGGVVTLDETPDPVLTNSDLVVLTWIGVDDNGNLVLKHRYNVAISVASLAITVSGGAGDDLPAQYATLYMGKQYRSTMLFDGDDIDTFVVTANVRGVVVFMDATDTQKYVCDLDAQGVALWVKDAGFTNPITGTSVAYVLVGSGSDGSADFAPKIFSFYDATSGSGQ